MIPKKVWSELHGFDERFVNGWEDNDLMLRMRELGYSVWVTGETHIRHVRHGSKAYGRLAKEDQNVQLFKSIWIDTNRIKQVL
jgi:GT2 family glycosyltransferase